MILELEWYKVLRLIYENKWTFMFIYAKKKKKKPKLNSDCG